MITLGSCKCIIVPNHHAPKNFGLGLRGGPRAPCHNFSQSIHNDPVRRTGAKPAPPQLPLWTAAFQTRLRPRTTRIEALFRSR
jgi:hypothetical protein